MAIDALSVASGAGCEAGSWSPEVISIYGDAETINRKMSNFDMNLPDRRIYIFTLETRDSAEVAFYERTSAEKVSVSRWQGKPEAGFHESINRAIVDNKGVNCVGEQTKAIVNKLPSLKKESDIAAPVNAKAAFSHAIRDRGGDYSRATIYLMC